LNVCYLSIIFAFLIVFLTAGLFLTTWYMLRFRYKLDGFINNARWEETLEKYHIYHKNEIVFFGDSQIFLWQMSPFFGSLPIRNRGVTGDLASKAVERFDRDVIASGRTKMVVILIGTNDIANNQPVATVVQDIEKMVKKAKENSIEVALCSLLPVNGDHKNNRSLDSLRSVNSSLRGISAQYNAIYVDFFSNLSDENSCFSFSYSDDGLHPNREGYFMMTKILLQSLKPNI
jgi:lysophospholipase L1-like esterase